MTTHMHEPQQQYVDSTQEVLTHQLVTFIKSELLVEEGGQIDAETPLLEMGILDSLAMVSLLAFVQNRFGVHIPDEAVVPEHFETLQALAQLITELRAGEPAAPSAMGRGDALLETVRLLETSGITRQSVSLTTGEEMHVLRVSGAAPTWILLPGLGNPSSSWGMMLRSLADDHAALAVDLAGFGLSFCPQERPTYDDHLRTTLALLGTMAEPPYILVGSSAGALIATAIARQHPEWIAALVITGFGLIADVEAWWQQLITLSAVPEQFLAAAYYRPPRLTDALRDVVAEVLARPAYYSFLQGSGRAAMSTAFDNLRVPTLFVAGENDRIIPPSAVEAAVARVPGAELEWLARCGHFPPAEQPEELLYVIRNFLATHGQRMLATSK